MSVDDTTLMAFADGEMSEAERAAVDAALAEDPALCEKLDAHRLLRKRLSTAFDSVLDEPIPARLAAAAAPRQAEVVSLAERRGARWSTREWGAMAASVAAGLLIGVGVMNTQNEAMLVSGDDGLVAGGALAQALDSQLASNPAGAVRIGLSFRARDGGYCRTFDLTHSDTSGLACREGGDWSVAMTASGGGGEVRMAGAAPQILEAVDAIIDGEPLDRVAEEEARERQWRGWRRRHTPE